MGASFEERAFLHAGCAEAAEVEGISVDRGQVRSTGIKELGSQEAR